MRTVPTSKLPCLVRALLFGNLPQTLIQGRIVPMLYFECATGRHYLPLDFDYMLSLATNMTSSEARESFLKSIGPPFFILGLMLMERPLCPKRLAAERADFLPMVPALLRCASPTAFVILCEARSPVLARCSQFSDQDTIVSIGVSSMEIRGLWMRVRRDRANRIDGHGEAADLDKFTAAALANDWYRVIYAPPLS